MLPIRTHSVRPLLFALAAAFSATAGAMGSHPAASNGDEALAARIKPVAHVEFVSDGKSGDAKPADAKPAEAKSANAKSSDAKPAEAKPAEAKSGDGKSGEDIVKATCSTCHQTGVAGAPKIGDKAAWAPRLAQGLDGLVKSATAGKNAMPPKGGATVSEIELTRAIVYMTNKSGASFKEPAGGK